MKALHRFDVLVDNALRDDSGALTSYEVARAVAKSKKSKEEDTATENARAAAKAPAA